MQAYELPNWWWCVGGDYRHLLRYAADERQVHSDDLRDVQDQVVAHQSFETSRFHCDPVPARSQIRRGYRPTEFVTVRVT
jgi:hypothetical protein